MTEQELNVEVSVKVKDLVSVVKLAEALKKNLTAIMVYRPTCLVPGCPNHGAYVKVMTRTDKSEWSTSVDRRCYEHQEPGFELSAGEKMLHEAVEEGTLALAEFLADTADDEKVKL